mgnify:CR=1 FL=1
MTPSSGPTSQPTGEEEKCSILQVVILVTQIIVSRQGFQQITFTEVYDMK